METPSSTLQPEQKEQSGAVGSKAPTRQSRSRAEVFTRGLQRARDTVRQQTNRLPELWAVAKKHPVRGVGIAIASGLGLAAVIGAAEAAVALSAGVLALQALTRPTADERRAAPRA